MIIWFFCVKLYYSSEKTSCICKEYIYLFFLHRKRPPCESIVKVRTVPHCFYKLMRGGLFPYFTVIVPLFVVNLIRLSPSPMTVSQLDSPKIVTFPLSTLASMIAFVGSFSV